LLESVYGPAEGPADCLIGVEQGISDE
jgi:hypothetical protein